VAGGWQLRQTGSQRQGSATTAAIANGVSPGRTEFIAGRSRKCQKSSGAGI
jgi:hypothetical protein